MSMYVELWDVDAYEWTCPNCETDNLVEGPFTQVKCEECKKTFKAKTVGRERN